MGANTTKEKKAIKPRLNHRSALGRTPEQIRKIEAEKVAKFMKDAQKFDFKADDCETAFELLCINTIGYVQPLARKLIFTLIQPSK